MLPEPVAVVPVNDVPVAVPVPVYVDGVGADLRFPDALVLSVYVDREPDVVEPAR